MKGKGLTFLDRFLGTVTCVNNTMTSMDLPRRYLYQNLELVLEGSIVVGVADGTAIPDLAPASLIKNIKITANGKDVIKNISGQNLHLVDYFKYNTQPHLTAPAVGVGTHAFKAVLMIDFAEIFNKIAIDTMFNSSGLATLQLEITWGTYADLVTPDTTTTLAWGTTPYIRVNSIEAFGGLDKPLLLNTEYVIQKQVTATADKFQIDLAVGNFYRYLLLKATDAGVRENDIINNIKLQSGQEVFVNLNDIDLHYYNKAKYNLETMPAGVYIIDLSRYGSMQDLLNASGMSDLKLELDVTVGTGDTFVDVVCAEYISPMVRVG